LHGCRYTPGRKRSVRQLAACAFLLEDHDDSKVARKGAAAALTHMSGRWAWVLATVALTRPLGVGLAQQPDLPTFRSQVNYVELPVRALDSKGSFVRDLTQADFQIFEDGKLQTIVDFALVDLPLPVRGATPQPAAAETAPPRSSNPAAVQVDGRMYLLVLDDDRVRPEYSLQFKRIVSGFVRDHMGAGDVAGIVFTSGAKGQDFTADRRLLLAAIDGFIGRYDGDIPRQSAVQLGVSSLGAPLDDELRARATLKTIEDISGAMANVKQRRKAVIYVSPTLGCALSGQTRPDRPPPVLPVDPLSRNPASEGSGKRPPGASHDSVRRHDLDDRAGRDAIRRQRLCDRPSRPAESDMGQPED
jgi:VWFA-related protein